MLKSAIMVQSYHHFYLFIGHPRNSFVQHLHSALNKQENLSLTMRSDSKLLDPSMKYAAYILDADHLPDIPQVIRSIRHRNPQARILVIAKDPKWEMVRDALRAGAMDMLPIPANAQHTRLLLEQILESRLPSDCRA